jgi:hypothetical protein
MSDRCRIAELERSNDELRGALIAAGRELRLVAQTKRRKVLLGLLRATLADARKIRRRVAAV